MEAQVNKIEKKEWTAPMLIEQDFEVTNGGSIQGVSEVSVFHS